MPSIRSLAEVERDHIIAALDEFGPRGKKAAAKALGISLKTLYVRIHQYGVSAKYIYA